MFLSPTFRQPETQKITTKMLKSANDVVIFDGKMKLKLGSAWMIVAAFLFAIMGILVKNATVRFHMNAYELAFWRSVLPASAIAISVLSRRQTLKSRLILGHLWRGTAGTVSLLLAFYGLQYLPLATSVTLSYTSAIFMALLSLIWLKEPPSVKTWLALLLGLVGVALMLRPSFQANLWWETLLNLGAGLFAAFALLQVRELSQAGEPAWRIVFYFSALATVGSAIMATAAGWHTLTWQSLPHLLGVGAAGLLAQLAMTQAYSEGRSKFTVAALSYLTIVFSAIYGMAFLGEPIDFWEIVGIITIIVAGILCALPEKTVRIAD
ncbi:MAG: DMT family transporter [Alysiella sp.]|uniref:DMT family transporter n=1 Tax=Alysiella sp. TaxID=1872483 RepID=UPI0026DD6F4A|nr:DMT family transporter [Alysiella sp.]MDO4433247.1 DMT family transporter [Alysiella sp.]